MRFRTPPGRRRSRRGEPSAVPVSSHGCREERVVRRRRAVVVQPVVAHRHPVADVDGDLRLRLLEADRLEDAARAGARDTAPRPPPRARSRGCDSRRSSSSSARRARILSRVSRSAQTSKRESAVMSVPANEPGGVQEQMLDHDRVELRAHLEPGQIVGDRRVQRQEAFVGELERDDRRERLPDRAELEERVLFDRPLPQLGPPELREKLVARPRGSSPPPPFREARGA